MNLTIESMTLTVNHINLNPFNGFSFRLTWNLLLFFLYLIEFQVLYPLKALHLINPDLPYFLRFSRVNFNRFFLLVINFVNLNPRSAHISIACSIRHFAVILSGFLMWSSYLIITDHPHGTFSGNYQQPAFVALLLFSKWPF